MNRSPEVQGKRFKVQGFRISPLYFVPCIFALLLSACGFHPRGPVTLPDLMARTELQGVDLHGELAREIEAVLIDSGGRLVESGEGAGAILEVTTDRFERRVASVDSQGKASQYQLRYVLSGLLRKPEGAALTPSRSATVARLLDAGETAMGGTNALATSSEEEVLRREMQRDAVRQLIRQLRASLLVEPSPVKPAP